MVGSTKVKMTREANTVVVIQQGSLAPFFPSSPSFGQQDDNSRS